jgi:D-amino-acid oxidase
MRHQINPPILTLHSVGKEGSLLQKLESNTFPELNRLAKDAPEAAIHFQGRPIPPNVVDAGICVNRYPQDTYSFSRKQDGKGAVGEWSAETVKIDPWWKDIVPNVQSYPQSF